VQSDQESSTPQRGKVQVVVATTVFLSFISFWRAAAIVLSDLGSSSFYAGGIAEQAVGKAAPWFILGVMLFSYAVRAVYMESCVMFVRGGVYPVVKAAMGGTLAKLSVSALLFDFVLTGPISAVSAGQYVLGLIADILQRSGHELPLPRNETAAVIAAAIIIYFWRRNTEGLHKSSGDALRIMQVTTVMVVLMIGWSVLTLLLRGGQLPPAPLPANLRFTRESLGWLWGTQLSTITAIAIVIGLGHSVLAMSGEETLAQIYREIEHPKAKNLRRAALVIFLYSLAFTSLVSFFAVAIIPDEVRPRFFDNLISGLAMHVVGPLGLRLAFQAFVVLVGFLILAGAVNTSIVGSNAVANRLSENGVLSDWFRSPHRRFGTTYRTLNIVVGLQLFTVLMSRGNVYLLGEAYAFGIMWSFAFESLAVLVLRYRDRSPREWRVPLNVRIGGTEVPVGLALVTLALFSLAVANLFTKQLATIAGVTFTLILYGTFTVSERRTARARAAAASSSGLDQFQLLPAGDVGLQEVQARLGNVLVPVRDYNTLAHLDWALSHTDTENRDVVVMTVRLLQGPNHGFRDFRSEQVFTDYEQLLFTRVVAIAERHGRPVKLLVVPSSNVFDAVAQTAIRLQSIEIIVGTSAKFSAAQQARLLGESWERIEKGGELRTRLLAYKPDGEIETFLLGAHVPPLTDEDVALIHGLWLKAVGEIGLEVHHRDIVRVALEEFQRDLSGEKRDEMLSRIREHARSAGPPPA
jgi:amino acid transporter